MTNTQRDELLISLSKGLNNLQESLNDFKKDVNNRFDYFDKKFNDKIDSVEQKLNTKIDSVEQKLNTKIDALAKDHEDFKNETRENFNELININRDIYTKTYSETRAHLQQHDIEIKELKAKLA